MTKMNSRYEQMMLIGDLERLGTMIPFEEDRIKTGKLFLIYNAFGCLDDYQMEVGREILARANAEIARVQAEDLAQFLARANGTN